MISETLTASQAHDIYDILMTECGAREAMRMDFVSSLTMRPHSEWRFQGALGFGGKFWRGAGFRLDNTYGETWYVNCYGEDLTDERRAKIDKANEKLAVLLLTYIGD